MKQNPKNPLTNRVKQTECGHQFFAGTLSAKTLGLVAALAFASTAMVSAQKAVPSNSTFGTTNDGLDGFTADARSELVSPWSVESDGALFTNAGDTINGQVNSSLLDDFAVDPFLVHRVTLFQLPSIG